MGRVGASAGSLGTSSRANESTVDTVFNMAVRKRKSVRLDSTDKRCLLSKEKPQALTSSLPGPGLHHPSWGVSSGGWDSARIKQARVYSSAISL